MSRKSFDRPPGGSHKGGLPQGLPLLWGEPPPGGVGGTLPPRLPPGGNGKGGFTIPSLLPQALCVPLRLHHPFPFRIADSPCFHSHSLVEHFAPVPVGVLHL